MTVVLSVLAIPAAAEAGPVVAAEGGGDRQDLRDLPDLAGFVRDRADDSASELSPELSVETLSSCHESNGSDPVGDSSGPDVVSYRMGSTCSTWALDVVTDDEWRARELDLFGMRIDIDYNTTTGCLGGDYVAAVTYRGGLVGSMVRTPHCDDTTWTSVGEIAASRTAADTIALEFPASAISNDTSFRWYLGLSSVDGGVDFAPDKSWMAVNPEATAPTAPRSLSATAGTGYARLVWRAPTSPGGTAVSDYVVQRSADGGRTWSTLDDGRSTDRLATVRRLTNGQRYRFRVAAANKAGRGPWSAVVTVVPAAVPTAPRRLIAASLHRAVRLTWLASKSNGGAVVRDDVVQRSGDGGQSWRRVPDGVRSRCSATVSGLRSWKRYILRVAAVNRAGRGAWSALVRARPR